MSECETEGHAHMRTRLSLMSGRCGFSVLGRMRVSRSLHGTVIHITSVMHGASRSRTTAGVGPGGEQGPRTGTSEMEGLSSLVILKVH